MIPPDHKRTKVVNLLTAWIGLALGIMVVIPSTFSVFFEHVAREFEWNRAQVSLAWSLFILASTIAFPFVGRLLDSLGAKMIIIPSVIVFMGGMLSFRFLVDALWLYYATYIVIGIAACGTSTLVYFMVVTRSFSRRRGLALGVANSGTAIGALSFPYVGYLLIEAFGWRDAYLILGTAITLVSIPVILLGLNDTYIDSTADDHRSAPGKGNPGVEGIPLSEALRSRIFWIIGIAFFCGATTLIGFLIHLVPMLTDRGLSAEVAAIATSTFGFAQLVGRLIAGFLLDKYPAARIASGIWLISTFTFVGLAAGTGGNMLIVITALLGLAWGSEGDVLAYFVGRYFGLKFFGAIYGSLLTMHLLGGVVGPYVLGMGFDHFGSYRIMLSGMAIVTIFAAVIILFAGPYPATVKTDNREVQLS